MDEPLVRGAVHDPLAVLALIVEALEAHLPEAPLGVST
jgi:hypothetical protein